jgi:hypothetical protein
MNNILATTRVATEAEAARKLDAVKKAVAEQKEIVNRQLDLYHEIDRVVREPDFNWGGEEHRRLRSRREDLADQSRHAVSKIVQTAAQLVELLTREEYREAPLALKVQKTRKQAEAPTRA